MVSSSIATGNVWTGWKAGSVFGLPVLRSKREPWRGHSTVQAAASNSPSASGPLSWEQRSSIAYSVPSQLKTPILVPSCSTRRISPGCSSAAGQTGILVPAVSVKRVVLQSAANAASADRDLILLLRSDFSGVPPRAGRPGDSQGSDEFVPELWSYLRNP